MASRFGARPSRICIWMIATSLLLVVFGTVSISGAAEFNWKRFQGSSIRYLANSHSFTNDIVRPSLKEFEELTGIKVTFEIFPEDQFRQKLAIELTAKSGTVDGFMSLGSFDAIRYWKAGWYEPLDKYLADKSLTDPEFAYDDFFPNTKELARFQGATVGLPLYPDLEFLFYRKDIFSREGLSAPATLEELEAFAKKLNKPQENFAGFVSRGKRSAAVYTFAPFLFSMGGVWLDKQGKPVFDSPESIKALDLYTRILRNYGPPGIANFNAPEIVDVFSQGRAAMALEWSGQVAPFEDPTKSRVVGKVGYAVMPKGPGGSHVPLIGWMVSMASQSKNKEATWYFLQWLDSKRTQLKAAAKAIPMSRQSVWNSEDFASKMPKDWLTTFKATLADAYANQANPFVEKVPETRDAIGEAIVAGLMGEDVTAAAKKAQKQLEQLILEK